MSLVSNGSLFDSSGLFPEDDPFLLDDLLSTESLVGGDVSMGVDIKPCLNQVSNHQQHHVDNSLTAIDPLLMFDNNIITDDDDLRSISPSISLEGEHLVLPRDDNSHFVVTEDACLEVHDYCAPKSSQKMSVMETASRLNVKKGHQRNGSTGSTPEGSLDDGIEDEEDIDFDEDEDSSHNDIDLLEEDDDEEENEQLSVNISNNNSHSKRKLWKKEVSCKSSRGSNASSTSSSPQSSSRRRTHMERHLTEEEKRLLSKEGYSNFPESGALTKQEEKILRKVRRKIRNKKSAQCSRQRKKEYVEELEKKYQKCSTENSSLKKEILKLRQENSSLLMKMKNMIKSVTVIKPSSTVTTTLSGARGASNATTTTITRSQSNLLRPLKVFSNSFLGSESSASSEHDTDDVSSNEDILESGQTSFKTSFFVLCLSFLLIIFPFMS